MLTMHMTGFARRIQMNSGYVEVTAAGAVALTAATGQAVTLTSGVGISINPAAGWPVSSTSFFSTDNNRGFQVKTTGGVATNVATIDGSNVVIIGAATLTTTLAGSSIKIDNYGSVGFNGANSSYRWRMSANATNVSAFLAEQSAPSATVPVAIVKLGSTPSNRAQEWQDSTGTALALVSSTGSIYSLSGGVEQVGIGASFGLYYVTALTQTTVGAGGGASALPATPTGYMKVSIGGTTKVVPYYEAV